jgi:RNA polymerase sigma factor (sigma-70 family)
MTGDYPKQNDRELIADCINGVPDAWEFLLVRYQRLIYSIPIKMGLSPNDAADVFQAVCLKLLENMSKLRHKDRISSWLTVTTRRESWRIAAQKKREHVTSFYDRDEAASVLSELPSTTAPLDRELEVIELQQILRDAVEQLPDRCRQMIKMLFYQEGDMSYVEIARRLGIPRTSMGPTRARCLAKLRKLLEDKL